MARTTLAERMTRLEQQKNRIAETETRLKLEERKARTRRLIEAGGLIEKAGLIDLDPNALYGALLSLKPSLDDAGKIASWKAEGGRAFDSEVKAREEGKVPLTVTLPGAQPLHATTRLRKLGFRFSKVMQHWEGLARYNEAAELAAELGGTVKRVGPAETDALAADGSNAGAPTAAAAE